MTAFYWGNIPSFSLLFDITLSLTDSPDTLIMPLVFINAI